MGMRWMVLACVVGCSAGGGQAVSGPDLGSPGGAAGTAAATGGSVATGGQQDAAGGAPGLGGVTATGGSLETGGTTTGGAGGTGGATGGTSGSTADAGLGGDPNHPPIGDPISIQVCRNNWTECTTSRFGSCPTDRPVCVTCLPDYSDPSRITSRCYCC